MWEAVVMVRGMAWARLPQLLLEASADTAVAPFIAIPGLGALRPPKVVGRALLPCPLTEGVPKGVMEADKAGEAMVSRTRTVEYPKVADLRRRWHLPTVR